MCNEKNPTPKKKILCHFSVILLFRYDKITFKYHELKFRLIAKKIYISDMYKDETKTIEYLKS